MSRDGKVKADGENEIDGHGAVNGQLNGLTGKDGDVKKTGLLIAVVVGLLVTSGCMSSGVIDMGHDKYTVSFNSLGGGANARAWAYQVATDSCRDQDREFYQVAESYSEVRGSATSSVTFKCLQKDDPQLIKYRNYAN